MHRRKTYARQFDDPAHFRFVPSIDGRAWSEEQAKTFISNDFYESWKRAKAGGKNYISAGAIACTLTHRDRLFPAAEQGDCILCEDDAVIGRRFIGLWQEAATRALFRSIGTRGPILLHYNEFNPITAHAAPVGTVGPYSLHRLKSFNIGSSASYYLHPDLATKLRAVQDPLVSICDSWVGLQPLAGYQDIFLLHPSPVRIAPHASTIGYREGPLSQMNNPAVRMLRAFNRYIVARQGQFSGRIARFE